MARQPNILVIQSDQHRRDCLGVNGHPQVRTPYLDALAASGVNTTHAFCPTPVCVPTRCTHLTSQWPVQHGSIANFDAECYKPLDPTTPTFARALKEAGYGVDYYGRWHVHPQLGAEAYGFDHYFPEWKHHVWREEQGLPSAPKENRWFGETDPHVSLETSTPGWMAQRVIARLKERAQGDEPFFLRWDTTAPHLPNRPCEPYASMYDPASIAPWPGFADTLAGKPYIQKQMRVTWGLDDYTWEDWAPVVARYFADITQLDAAIGMVLDAVDELGLRDDLIVVYTSDHGDMTGSHGMIDKHCVMYDDIVRVPLIVRDPRLPELAGTTADAFMLNSLDLPCTYLNWAGAEAPKTFRGSSLVDRLSGKDKGAPYVFSTYSGNQFGAYTMRMIRDKRWKYIWNATAEDELYDLEADPGEGVNRIHDSREHERVQTMRHALVDWMRAEKDPMANTWTDPALREGRIL